MPLSLLDHWLKMLCDISSFSFRSALGQDLETSTYVWEICFAVSVSISGLVLFSFLIGNMQVGRYVLLIFTVCTWVLSIIILDNAMYDTFKIDRNVATDMLNRYLYMDRLYRVMISLTYLL